MESKTITIDDITYNISDLPSHIQYYISQLDECKLIEYDLKNELFKIQMAIYGITVKIISEIK